MTLPLLLLLIALDAPAEVTTETLVVSDSSGPVTSPTNAPPTAAVEAAEVPDSGPASSHTSMKEVSLGFQRLAEEGFLAVGYSLDVHELRVLGSPSQATGPALALSYRASIVNLNKIKLTAGGLLRYPLRGGAHLGMAYRTGGESFLGRLSLGVDAGAMCGLASSQEACSPVAGVSFALHFTEAEIF